MGYFDKLSIEEVAALDDDAVTKVVNLQCADQGIPVFISNEPEPKIEVLPDKTFYKVGDWMFDDADVADEIREKVASARRFRGGYSWSDNSAKLKAEPDESDIKVEQVKLFSPEHYQRFQAEIRAQQVRLDAWQRTQEEDKKAIDKKSGVYNAVWKEVNAAREKIRETKRLDVAFGKYVELADGNRQMARKFLLKAEHLDSTWYPSDWVHDEAMEAATA